MVFAAGWCARLCCVMLVWGGLLDAQPSSANALVKQFTAAPQRRPLALGRPLGRSRPRCFPGGVALRVAF